MLKTSAPFKLLFTFSIPVIFTIYLYNIKFGICQWMIFIAFYFLIHYNVSMMTKSKMGWLPNRLVRPGHFLLIMTLFFIILFPSMQQAEIYTLEIKGPIESITSEYIDDSFKKINQASNAKLVIIKIDTPGGFDTSMRSIIKNIMASPVPVAVFVYPRGARAASAGFFITISADIAAMAPGTNMGAAHPVAVGGQKMDDVMKDKVTNDAVSYAKSLAKSRQRNLDLAEKAVRESKSYTAEECLKNELIEYISDDSQKLIQQLEGKIITSLNGKTFTLNLKGEKIVPLDMSARQKFLKTITNPSLAYFLLIFGLIGLYLEFTHPGILVPGILGGISLLLAFMAFQVLPINYIGLLLILLSIGFFIAEIKIQGFGMFGIGGIISFVLGSIMLINSPIPEMRPSMLTIVSFAFAFAAIFGFLTYKVLQAMQRKSETGQEGMSGEIGVAKTEITQISGKVLVHGEWWNAVTDSVTHIPVDTKVTVRSLKNFVLTVTPAEDAAAD
jgi:membrane-bound serine protease (ClpP class)